MPPVLILATGMACPVGWHTASALAAMRAGITRFTEVGELVGPGGPVRASRLASLDPEAPRGTRVAAFARRALQETVANLADFGERPLPCFLALPEPGVGPRLDLDALLRDFVGIPTASGAPVRLDLRRSDETGRAGVFSCLRAATEALLGPGAERFAVVGGLDSLADPLTLADLAAHNRLLGRSNLDGVLPGEGAAFMLLARQAGPPRPAAARLVATEIAREPVPFRGAGERLGTAEALTAVFHRLHGAYPGRVDEVFAGTTNAGYFGREFSHAYLRVAALMPEPLRCTSPYAALGDVGAAAGAIGIIQAVASLAVHRSVLVYASSDTGPVGACVLARP